MNDILYRSIQFDPPNQSLLTQFHHQLSTVCIESIWWIKIYTCNDRAIELWLILDRVCSTTSNSLSGAICIVDRLESDQLLLSNCVCLSICCIHISSTHSPSSLNLLGTQLLNWTRFLVCGLFFHYESDYFTSGQITRSITWLNRVKLSPIEFSCSLFTLDSSSSREHLSPFNLSFVIDSTHPRLVSMVDWWPSHQIGSMVSRWIQC